MRIPASLHSAFAPIAIDPIDIRGHDEQIGFELASQQLAGEVFVDHCFDAVQLAVLTWDIGGRNSASTGTDHDDALVEQPANRANLEDPARRWRWDDPAPVFAIWLHDPALFRRNPIGLGFVVNRSDELGRVRECGIIRIDLDHCQDGGQGLFRRQQIPQLDFEHVPDHALGFGAEHIERIGLDSLIGVRLQREQTDLRAVAMGHHDFMVGHQGRDCRRGYLHIRLLILLRHRLPTFEQGIASERDHDSHDVLLSCRLTLWPLRSSRARGRVEDRSIAPPRY